MVGLLAISLTPTTASASPACEFYCGDTVQTTVEGFATSQSRQSTSERQSETGAALSPTSSSGAIADPHGPLMEYDYRAPCDVPGATAQCGLGTLKCAVASA